MTRALVKATLWGLILIAATPAAAAEPWVVQNERVAVTFTAEAHGAVTSLIDKATGRELAARQPRPQLFQLEFSTPGFLAAADGQQLRRESRRIQRVR